MCSQHVPNELIRRELVSHSVGHPAVEHLVEVTLAVHYVGRFSLEVGLCQFRLHQQRPELHINFGAIFTTVRKRHSRTEPKNRGLSKFYAEHGTQWLYFQGTRMA